MTTQAYRDWLADGKPYVLAQPCADLVRELRGQGYVVYHYPDDRHLLADPPEDHTPFSATGWPVKSAYPVGHAIDVMPTKGVADLAALARRILAGKNADAPGLAALKYMNWTDVDGSCWHESWQPDHVRRTSTDRGHIHLSMRSDSDTQHATLTGAALPTGGTTVTSVWDEDAIPAPPDATDRAINPYWRAKMALADVQLHVRSTDKAVVDMKSQVATLVARPVQPTDPGLLVSALVQALADRPELVDALATAVAARLGMIPTAGEIAREVGALTWRGVPQG